MSFARERSIARERHAIAQRARRDLDKGLFWEFKIFTLFPILQHLRYLDFVFRVVFPIAFAIYVFAMLASVGFGSAHFAKLMTAPCYVTATSGGA